MLHPYVQANSEDDQVRRGQYHRRPAKDIACPVSEPEPPGILNTYNSRIPRGHPVRTGFMEIFTRKPQNNIAITCERDAAANLNLRGPVHWEAARLPRVAGRMRENRK
uniref:Uncharacterized protein n=1 Tax=Anopheles merus TaxID=30066 RepID=A0A182V2E8_ANOME